MRIDNDKTCFKESKMPFYVDIPDCNQNPDDPNASFVNIGTFDSQAEAIAAAQRWYGADTEGRIQLVSGQEGE